MSPQDFVYWLQGFFELSEAASEDGEAKALPLSAKQTQIIRNHLDLVFVHSIDPAQTAHLSPEEAKKVQEKLQGIHDKPPVFLGHPVPGSGPTTYRC